MELRKKTILDGWVGVVGLAGNKANSASLVLVVELRLSLAIDY